MGKVSRSEAPPDAPAGRDCRERLENEAAPFQSIMRNREASASKLATAPQCDVEVEHAGRPMLAGPTAEVAFDLLDALKHLWRLEFAFDDGHGVGEVASCPSYGRIEKDRRSVKQAEILIEASNGSFNDAAGLAEAAVRPIGPDGDGIEVRCVWHLASPRSA